MIVVGKMCMWGPVMIHCYIVLAGPNLCTIASWLAGVCKDVEIFSDLGKMTFEHLVELKPPTIVVVS